MITGAASRRYAKAIVAIGKKDHAVFEQLENFQQTLQSSPMLQTVLANPVFGIGERIKILDGISSKLQLSVEVKHILELLVKRERFIQFSHIMLILRELRDEEQNILRVQVYTSTTLSAQDQEGLSKALALRTGKTVFVTVTIDPNLLGGMILKVGDMVYDASLATRLQSLTQQLLV